MASERTAGGPLAIADADTAGFGKSNLAAEDRKGRLPTRRRMLPKRASHTLKGKLSGVTHSWIDFRGPAPVACIQPIGSPVNHFRKMKRSFQNTNTVIMSTNARPILKPISCERSLSGRRRMPSIA